MRARLPSRRAVALLPLLAAAALARPGAAGACSIVPFPPSRSGTHFLATPLADTVFAGRVAAGEDGLARAVRASRRRVHGQRVRLLRAGGENAAVLAPLLARGPAEAVLVPWETDPSCRPAPWRRSFRWLQPGEAGLLRARLRERPYWVAGRPTFDVFLAGAGPYPRLGPVPVPGAPGERALTAGELFALYGVLPDYRETDRAPARAYAPLLAWARANPALALRYPARDMVTSAVESLHLDALRRLRSPLAGTYRVTVSIRGRRDVALLLRTGDVMSPWFYAPERPRTVDELLRTRARGYALYTTASEPASGWRTQFPVYLLEEPGAGRSGERVWKGRVDFPWRDPGAPAAVRPVLEAHRQAMDGRPQEWAPAVFRMSRDGRVTVEQTITQDGRVLGRLRGERISSETRR